MYAIGDKVVYPMHGAGVIDSIEEKEFLGQKSLYYVLRFPVGGMKVMVPVDNVVEIGIRDVISDAKAEEVMDSFSLKADESNDNWNKRYRDNMFKIKSGDIFEVASVVRSLVSRERERGLSMGERKMLSNARQILISELVLAKGAEPTEIESRINLTMGAGIAPIGAQRGD
ncbi:MAG: CarD family transcriptional regulator [Oscillospiraceae bacterium]|nr:CarD family transcriptional regulator [Oscillospiraceae bacterium]